MELKRARVQLKSYRHDSLNEATKDVRETAEGYNCIVKGPVYLPTKRRIYCVLRSPHVNKDSREHFEIRTHKRILDLYSKDAVANDILFEVELPSGVVGSLIK